MGKSTISMAMFNSKMLVHQRVNPMNIQLNHYKIPLNHYKIPLNHYKIPLNHQRVSIPDFMDWWPCAPRSPCCHPILGHAPSASAGWCHCPWRPPGRRPCAELRRGSLDHGSLNVPIEHHPTIRYMVYKCLLDGYYKVMSNIPKSWDIYQPL